jgi:hypothetical protein
VGWQQNYRHRRLLLRDGADSFDEALVVLWGNTADKMLTTGDYYSFSNLLVTFYLGSHQLNSTGNIVVQVGCSVVSCFVS